MDRACLRCGTKMVEECKAEIWGSFWRIGTITKKSASAPCRCAVCPKCGYTELYVTEPEAFRRFLKKNKQADCRTGRPLQSTCGCFYTIYKSPRFTTSSDPNKV